MLLLGTGNHSLLQNLTCIGGCVHACDNLVIVVLVAEILPATAQPAQQWKIVGAEKQSHCETSKYARWTLK